MKVKIVEENLFFKGINYGPAHLLVVGKEYNVFKETDVFYEIINESGKLESYLKSRFEIVKGEEQMKVTLPNGLVVEGTQEQVNQIARYYGFSSYGYPPNEYYNSESKGWIRIKDMATMHLRNAILKQYREWVENLSSEKNPAKLIYILRMGLLDVTWLAMVKEYSTRKEE